MAAYSSAQLLDETQFIGDLIDRLRQLQEPAAWIGLSAVIWAQTFSGDLAIRLASAGYAELGRRLNRAELLLVCARQDIPLEFRIAAVLAWGRSNSRRPQNNRNLWASIANISPLINQFAKLTRTQAFDEFQRLIASGALRGMRASFFTKLMFFFGCPGAYILDQWMAKSMLAVLASNWRLGADGTFVFARASDNFVHLGYGGTSIGLSMSGDDYEKYCVTLESLIGPLGHTNAAEVERYLFSEPGSEWRRFLKGLDWKVDMGRPAQPT